MMDDYPDNDYIDPDRAKYLYEHHCSILIVQDIPVGSEFGIDLMTYRIGEKFKGIKLIPPGVHFVYASACPANLDDNTPTSNGPRCGFFHHFKRKELLIKRWSVEEEDFDDDYQPSEELYQRYGLNLRDLDQYLGAYSYSKYQTYLKLTNKLTVDIVDFLNPDCKRIRSVPFLVRDEKEEESTTSIEAVNLSCEHQKPTEEKLLPHLKPHQSTVIHFTKIPIDHRELGENLTGSKITEYNLDTSMKLDHLFKSASFGIDQILAELQFAFLTFLFCHVYECFEHWKKLLNLLCKVDSSLQKYPKFYREFLEILEHQVDQIPEDLFEDITDSNNLIRTLLDTLFQNLDSLCNIDKSEDKQALTECAGRLQEYLEKKFNWTFGLERDDENPVIVDL